MRKLTVNRLALGSIKRRRGQYKAMILGAGLAIFFVSALFLSVQTILETYHMAHIARVGREDAILRNAEKVTPEALIEGGMAAEVGSVYILGETREGGCTVGYYDEAGVKLAAPTVAEGRMPQAAGEIAVEPNFLQKLRSDKAVGDEITLTLNIPRGVRAEFLPEPVEKTYRIVGIIKPQSIYLTGDSYSDGAYLQYPSAILSAEEQVEPGGRAMVHRLVLLAPGVSFARFERYAREEPDAWNAMSTEFDLFSGGGQESALNSTGQMMVVVAGIIGAVLVLSACLGIVNALSSSLSQRRAQIGMMRAVGATGRQILNIFGREALLLAAMIAPVAIGLSYLFVWALTLLIEPISFYANPWFLPVIFLGSMLCVALAAWAPLVSASKLPPMQAIREVSLLRARRRIRVRAKRRYDAPRLIASRHLALYRTRQGGICVMVALSMLLISLGLPLLLSMWSRSSSYAFQIVGYDQPTDFFVETNVTAHKGLNDADVSEALALPMVSSVDVASHAQVNLLMDRVTPYAASFGYPEFYQDFDGPEWDSPRAVYDKFRTAQKLSREALSVQMYGCEEHLIASLQPYVLEGKIDLDALNAGREVLCIAPEVYYQWQEEDGDGGTSGGMGYTQAWGKEDVTTTYTNDTYHAGDELSILRLYSRGAPTDLSESDYVTGIERQEATATIGAILSVDASEVLNDALRYFYIGPGMLYTTHAGMAALGIETGGYFNLSVRLSGAPDAETRAYLADVLGLMAARGLDMTFIDNIQKAQDDLLWQTVLRACLLAVSLLMMAMCVSLVNNAITSRVRSDKRSIGTLRAVGASLQDIVKSYRFQAFAMIGWGVLSGVLVSAAYYVWQYASNYYPNGRAFDIPLGGVALAQGIFLAAVALLCAVNLHIRIREITRASIVSNIREL